MLYRVTSRPSIISQIIKEIRIYNGFSIYGAAEYLGYNKERVLSIESNLSEVEFAVVLRYNRMMEVPMPILMEWVEDVEAKLHHLGCEVVDYCEEEDDFFCDEGNFREEEDDDDDDDDDPSALQDREAVRQLIRQMVSGHCRRPIRSQPRRYPSKRVFSR